MEALISPRWIELAGIETVGLGTEPERLVECVSGELGVAIDLDEDAALTLHTRDLAPIAEMGRPCVGEELRDRRHSLVNSRSA